jgi:hypothetical protein
MQRRKFSQLPYSGLRIAKSAVTLFLIGGLLFSVDLTGQDTGGFKPGGKPEVRIFTSFGTTVSGGENHTSFDLGRAYLGYNYNFTEKLSGRIVYDVADQSIAKYKFTGLLKFAYLKYQTDRWTISGGMIPLPEYGYAEKKWGYRYIYKPSLDIYGFVGPSDLGISVACNIASWISADVSLVNGEGFKLTEADSTFKESAGITLTPVKNLSLRGYFDNMGKDGVSQQTLEFIASYETGSAGISASFHLRRNDGLTDGHDYHGFSVNGRLALNEKISIIGRYDFITSVKLENEDDPWNLSDDGQLFLAAIEFSLAPGVSLAPNFSGWKPSDRSMPFISNFTVSLDLKI